MKKHTNLEDALLEIEALRSVLLSCGMVPHADQVVKDAFWLRDEKSRPREQSE